MQLKFCLNYSTEWKYLIVLSYRRLGYVALLLKNNVISIASTFQQVPRKRRLIGNFDKW